MYAESEEQLTKRLNNNNRNIILIIILSVVFSIFYREWKESKLFKVEYVEMNNLHVLSKSTELCHGDKLSFGYDLHIAGDGILIRDLTVWRVDPPQTIIYSEFRRSIINEETDQHHIETFKIPHSYHNYETDEWEPIPPGRYERRFSISSPSNLEAFTKASIPFTIKEKCPR